MASTGEAATWSRRPELDGLRGVAILLVLAGHAFAEQRFASLASAGVTIFFALSGYLITGTLIAERTRSDSSSIALRRFYWRRMTRLAPPLLVMIAVMSVMTRPGWGATWAALTWSTNYAALTGVKVGIFGHAWSLAVEEQFYLVWPLALMWLIRRRRPGATLAAITVALLIWRVVVTGAGEFRYAYYATETAGVGLLGGCLVALLGWRLRGRDTTAALVLIFVVSVAASIAAGGLLWFVVPLAVMPLAAIAVAGSSDTHWLRLSWLRWFGVASYSLYLWHLPVSHALGSGGLTPIGVTVGVVVGSVAWWVLERPLMKWRAQGAAKDAPAKASGLPSIRPAVGSAIHPTSRAPSRCSLRPDSSRQSA